MKPLHWLLDLFPVRTTSETDLDASRIETALEASAQQLRAADPEAVQQWRSLDLAISRAASPAAS